MRSWRSLKLSHTQTSVPCGTLNYLVLLGKWYINSQKVKKRQLMFCEFLLFVKCKLENIKMSFIMYKNLDLFIERYGRLYQHLSVLEL